VPEKQPTAACAQPAHEHAHQQLIEAICELCQPLKASIQPEYCTYLFQPKGSTDKSSNRLPIGDKLFEL
jgi:hypothetical protein